MKKLLIALLCTVITPLVWADANNQNITAIFGGGNTSAGWTSDTGSGITLALRAKNRNDNNTTNINGVYSFATAPATRGLWNYEFSINSGTAFLDTYDYFLAADRDSSMGISYSLVQPLSHWGDNSFGNSLTTAGNGVEPGSIPDYLLFPSTYSVAQNSQNITFGDYPGGSALVLEQDATYNYELFAVAKGAGSSGKRLVDVGIQVVVGNGGARVPDASSTLILLALGLIGISVFRNRTGLKSV
jgi:hypothetical protein